MEKWLSVYELRYFRVLQTRYVEIYNGIARFPCGSTAFFLDQQISSCNMWMNW